MGLVRDGAAAAKLGDYTVTSAPVMKRRRAQERTQHRPIAVPSSHCPPWSDPASKKFECVRTYRPRCSSGSAVVGLDRDRVDLAARARCEERIGRTSPIGDVPLATTGLRSFVRLPYDSM
jgi:hypothetical protein